jgi:outer membrane protein TolC
VARRENQRAVDEVVSQARSGYQPTLGLTGGVLGSETALPLLGQINASGVGPGP